MRFFWKKGAMRFQLLYDAMRLPSLAMTVTLLVLQEFCVNVKLSAVRGC